MMLAGALRGGQGGVVATERVEERGRGSLGAGDHARLPAGRGVGARPPDALERERLIALPAREQDGRVVQRRAADRLRDGVRLVDDRPRIGELSAEDQRACMQVDGGRQQRERARVARELNVARREHVPGFVLPKDASR